jgi:hypothetical protein
MAGSSTNIRAVKKNQTAAKMQVALSVKCRNISMPEIKDA